LRFDLFIARRISYRSKRSFSKVIIRIAVMAIVLSLAIMLISDSIYIGFQNEIKDKITGFGGHIQLSKANSDFTFENDPININNGFIKKVKHLPGVRHIQVFATKPGILKSSTGIEGVVLKGGGKDFDWSFIKQHLLSGSKINYPDSEASNEIIISKNLADRLNIQLNEEVVTYFIQQPPRVRKFKVKGIYSTGMDEVDKTFILCDIRQIQKLNNWGPAQVAGYEINLDDSRKLDEVNDEVSYLADVREESRTIIQRYPQLFDWLSLISKNLEVIIVLMLIVAIINMSTALIIMILERTQMVGIFKSMGATNWAIQRIFIFNAARVIGIGILLGNLFGLGMLFLQKFTHFITLSEESYSLAYVPVQFSLHRILLINLGAFLVCSLAMVLPSLFILRIKPSRALRFE
jgi:lipoprotein-releasing system permease protein